MAGPRNQPEDIHPSPASDVRNRRLIHRLTPAPVLAAIALVVLFTVLGLPFVHKTGVQMDESLFGTAIYAVNEIEYSYVIGGHKLPVMVMTYVGALKAWLYMPLLKLSEAPGRALLRIPTLLLGALSVGLFFLLMRRLIGNAKVALLCALLLATDASYLMTCVYDWGPVAIQHVLFIASMYTVVRYAQGGTRWWLFAASLCAGMAMWDKALFAWILSGMGVALVAVFRREFWRTIKDRRALAPILLGFVIGAAPLIHYNLSNDFKTFAGNTQFDFSRASITTKILLLDRTLDGSGLFGYLVRQSPAGKELEATGWERLPVAISRYSNGPERSYQVLLFAAAAFCLAFVLTGPHARLALVFVLGGTIAYLQMLLTKDVGGSTHHVILMYPLPQIITGLVLAEATRRFPRRGVVAASLVVLLACASNLAVTNHYLANLVRFGPTATWSDASFVLTEKLASRPNRNVYAVDWGISLPIKFLTKAAIGIHDLSVDVADDSEDALALERALDSPASLFVAHSEGSEVDAGSRQKLLDFATQRGYRPEIQTTVYDRYQAPVFEIYEFKR